MLAVLLAAAGRVCASTDAGYEDVVGKERGSEKLALPREGGVLQLCLRLVDAHVTPPVFLKTQERLIPRLLLGGKWWPVAVCQ
ncbi:hypothetical protein L7F22_036336, partial [Adiantum nelumboides]|nr:hypothetical protein [Adiantum nelumboides]